MRFLEKKKNQQATTPKCIINMLDWHLERRKKLLLKFNINLARLRAELEEHSATQWTMGDRSDVISTPKAEITEKRTACDSLCSGSLCSYKNTSQILRVYLVPVLPLHSGFSF